MAPSNFPLSEKRDQSDGDSVRFRNDVNSDEEEIENDNENVNSVEGTLKFLFQHQAQKKMREI